MTSGQVWPVGRWSEVMLDQLLRSTVGLTGPRTDNTRLRQPRRGRLVSARIHGDGRRVRTVRGRRLRAPFQLVGLARGRVGVMIVARTSTGRTVVHTRRYRTCAR
jgi:hypothetical protein